MDSTDRRGTWAIVLVVLVVLFLLLSRCSGSGGSTRVGAVPNSAGPAEPAPPTATREPTGDGGPNESSDQPTTETRSGTLTVDGDPVDTDPGDGGLIRLTGKRAVARGARVLSVPADEGFWIGTGSSDRIWVQLTGPPPESPYTVRPDDRVSFTGRITRNSSNFALAVGVTKAEGAATLTAQRRHLSVPKQGLTLIP